MAGPVRRTQPLHPAALLIDHQHRVLGQHAAQFGHKAGELRGGFDVAAEQDDARRPCRGQQMRLLGGQPGPGNPDDGGFQEWASVQTVPFWRTCSQNAVAVAIVAKPPVRRR